MLYKLSKSGVGDYHEGQTPLVYLICWAGDVHKANRRIVFTDGHSIAAYTHWYDDLAQLDLLDWPLILSRDWADTLEDNDRKRRKQAEFLVYESLHWSLVKGIAVINHEMADRVKAVLDQFPEIHHPQIGVVPRWYY